MSKVEVKADPRTEFKLSERTAIIVSDSTHTICGIRIPKGNTGETLIVSSNSSCNFGEKITTVFMMAALDHNEQYRSEFVDMLKHIDFGKDFTALLAVSAVSNFALYGNVKNGVKSILSEHNFTLIRSRIIGESASKGA